jgi:predicted SAM-dependent methyltransferase
MRNRQVDPAHYRFSSYVDKKRWSSLWHQLDEVLSLGPNSVLEIGPGPGLFKALASTMGVKVETLDLDSELRPDHVASATAIPLASASYDVVCAFQTLEHLPFAESLSAFSEMVRVSRGMVVVSLPDARRVWRLTLHIPKRGPRHLLIPKPRLKPEQHKFDGEHYWEISKEGYELSKVISRFESAANAKLVKTFRVIEYPYHRFLVFAEHIS